MYCNAFILVDLQYDTDKMGNILCIYVKVVPTFKLA